MIKFIGPQLLKLEAWRNTTICHAYKTNLAPFLWAAPFSLLFVAAQFIITIFQSFVSDSLVLNSLKLC